MRRTLIITLALSIVLALSTGAQQPPAAPPDQPAVTFRVEVNYVEVDAAVFDRQGNFVNDLRREDFQILEDGIAQDVTAFSLVSIPIERSDTPQPLFASRPIEPDVVTNARPFDGRLYVIVLDDLHIGPFRTSRVRRAAKDFVEKYMAANDLAAVVHTSGLGRSGQEFTASKSLLTAAIDRFTGQKLRSATAERLDDYQRQRQIPSGPGPGGEITRVNDQLEAQRGHYALRTLDVLDSITEWVGSIRGRRKAIVFLSEGIDYDIYDFNKREASSIQDRMRDIIATSARSNVSIYSADPRGLTTMGEESIEVMGGFPEDQMLNLRPTSYLDELRLGQTNLRSLSEDTGGFAAVDTNDLTSAWARVVKDNSQYYVLGYYSKNERRDGRFRRIELKIPGREGLDVRYRKGYTALRGKPAAPPTRNNDQTSPELRQALDSPIPLPGITLRVHAAAFRGEKPKAGVSVGVELEGADLQFTSKNGTFTNDLEISVVAIDTSGKIQGGDRSVLKLDLKPDTRARITASGIRTQTRLSLAPGRYQIRVGVRESVGGRVGTLNYDLEVPDFSKNRLTMSGIVLTSASAQHLMTAKTDEALKDVLPAPATAARAFPAGDRLAVFAEVYDNQPATPHVVDIKTTILSDDGRTVFTTAEERSSTELQGKSGGYGHAAQIALKEFTPGMYVLRVEARSREGNDPPVMQELIFAVRPS